MEWLGASIVGGLFTLIAVTFGWRLTARDTRRAVDQRDAITLAEVAGSISRIDDNVKLLWDAVDGVRGDTAFMAGRLNVTLPARR